MKWEGVARPYMMISDHGNLIASLKVAIWLYQSKEGTFYGHYELMGELPNWVKSTVKTKGSFRDLEDLNEKLENLYNSAEKLKVKKDRTSRLWQTIKELERRHAILETELSEAKEALDRYAAGERSV